MAEPEISEAAKLGARDRVAYLRAAERELRNAAVVLRAEPWDLWVGGELPPFRVANAVDTYAAGFRRLTEAIEEKYGLKKE